VHRVVAPRPRPCPICVARYGQTPSAWGDSKAELDAYDEHLRHADLRTQAIDAVTKLDETHPGDLTLAQLVDAVIDVLAPHVRSSQPTEYKEAR
jgi:dsDNA-binding SOS-regulon protein